MTASGGYSFGNKAIVIYLKAYFKRVKSNKSKHPTLKPDLDNIEKAVLDGLNGAAFKDDKQVTELTAAKCYCKDGECPHIVVRIIDYEQ